MKGDLGGTSPEAILKQDKTLEEIRTCDIWYLLTDGEIASYAVENLTRSADAYNLTHIPVVLVIVQRKPSTPDQTNISVGIPFFATTREALVLFKDWKSEEIFVIAAKGSFAPLARSTKKASSIDLSSWKSLPKYANEAELVRRCGELGITLVSGKDRQVTKSISLGPRWDSATHALVDVGKLLSQKVLEPSDLANLLEEEAINQLAVVCKTRNQIEDLRNLLKRHRCEETAVRFEDRHGAQNILEALQNTDISVNEAERLKEELREAHAANRATYIHLKSSPGEEALRAKETNRLIDRGLSTLAYYEKAGYTAELISRQSNRARRAAVTCAADADIHLSFLDLSDFANAFRSSCSICCGEDQIMSVVLKTLESVEDNTSDFALNFPLAAAQAPQNADMISSQLICFQCALLCQKSIFKEALSAILPTVGYQGCNKPYMNHQLTLAVTAGLETGISGIGQIFMAILDLALETKHWCADQSHLQIADQDPETSLRHDSLNWMLQTFLKNCQARENFSETGKWVEYPQALKWAAKDFEQMGLDSWVIQYPLSGFNQILRWFDILELGIRPETVTAMLQTKLIQLVVTNMLSYLLQDRARTGKWTYPFLQLIYREFNASSVPRDLGSASILQAEGFWNKLKTALGQRQDVVRFLEHFTPLARRDMVERLQIVVFWALYTQKGHTSPKTFFHTIQLKEPLASVALAPTTKLSEAAVHETLLSIFLPSVQYTRSSHSVDFTPPFVSPYGASILECGEPLCPVKFYTDLDPTSLNPAKVRARRAEHLKEIFGVDAEFHTSPTGLPEPTLAPVAPISAHANLHMSVVRVWSSLNRTTSDDSHPDGVHDPSKNPNISSLPSRAPTLSNIQLPSKEEIMSGAEHAITAFVNEVQLEICERNHRGNIYHAGFQYTIRSVLPSFFLALRVASQKLQLEDGSGLRFVHDRERATVAAKIEWELGLGG